MKKRILALLMAAVFAVCMFSACGGSANTATAAPAPTEGAATEAVTTGAAATEAAPAGQTYEFNLATAFYDPAASPDFNTDGSAAQKFAELVSEKSNGRIKINIHWASVLGSNNEALEMLRNGEIDMNMSNVFSSLDSRLGAFNMPNLIDDFDMAYDLFVKKDGAFFKTMHDILADNHIELLSGSIGQFRGLFNNKKEVHVPADCKDLMLRAYSDEIVTTYWNGIANTTIMSVPDIYTGLQLGTIDGFEFSPVTMVANGYTEVVKNYSDINWQWQSAVNVMMNQKLFSSLDEEAQNILLDSAMEATGEYYKEMMLQCSADANDYMLSNNISVYSLTDEERQQWIDYGVSLLPQFKELVGAEVFDALVNASNEYRASHK